MSCAVIVVPMFAPKMTEIAWGRPMSPALTKPIVMTVTRAPARAPMTGFFVRKARIFLIFSPAAFCSASLMLFMPNRKIARPPSSPNTVIRMLFIRKFHLWVHNCQCTFTCV